MAVAAPRPSARVHTVHEGVAVHPSIERVRSEIEALCRRLGIRSLELFGSAAGPGFDPDRSDVDVLVDLGPRATDSSGLYFELKEELERLLGRTVDLVVDDAVVNPYLRRSIDEQRVALYAA